MKIIYLHQYFTSPDMSGGTRSYEMARRMVAAGHEVHMVTTRTDGAFSGRQWVQTQVEGIHVHWLPVRYDNAMGYGRRILAFTAFARHAARYAAKLGGDVVFATSTPLTIAIPGVLASKKLGIPMVFEVRDLWPELPIAMGALNLPFAKSAARLLERWAYRNSSRVVGLSPGMCDGVKACGYPESNIVCIPNSCDIELFDVPEQEGAAFRSVRPWLGSRKLVLYSGTLGRINGVSYLAELAGEMLLIDPEVRFLVIGNGAEKALVRDRAQQLGVLNKNFFMEEAIPKSQMPSVLSAATVCCSLFIPLSPMWNNSANKFFDALAAGKPVLINYGGWQADLLARTRAGISIGHQDLPRAARELHQLLADGVRLEGARHAAKGLAQGDFSRDHLAKSLIGVLEDVVGVERN